MIEILKLTKKKLFSEIFYKYHMSQKVMKITNRLTNPYFIFLATF